jgi:hypothetical protein
MTHDVPNLGIIDGSVFVTAGAVNPTSTICALALRAARRLIERRTSVVLQERPRVQVFNLKHASVPSPPAAVAPQSLSAEEKERLIAMGNHLIPAVDDLPGAGTLIVQEKLLERVLGVRPDVCAPLRRALAEPQGMANDREAWMALVTTVAGGYYLHQKVRERIGYEGQVPRQTRPDNYPAYLAEGLLDHLLDDEWKRRWEHSEPATAALEHAKENA